MLVRLCSSARPFSPGLVGGHQRASTSVPRGPVSGNARRATRRQRAPSAKHRGYKRRAASYPDAMHARRASRHGGTTVNHTQTHAHAQQPRSSHHNAQNTRLQTLSLDSRPHTRRDDKRRASGATLTDTPCTDAFVISSCANGRQCSSALQADGWSTAAANHGGRAEQQLRALLCGRPFWLVTPCSLHATSLFDGCGLFAAFPSLHTPCPTRHAASHTWLDSHCRSLAVAS